MFFARLLALSTAASFVAAHAIDWAVSIAHKPWVVGFEDEENRQSKCAGVLIAPDFVLTAAHRPRSYYVRFDTPSSNVESETIKIRRHVMHPNASLPNTLYGHDYMLFQLERPASVVPLPVFIGKVTPFSTAYASFITWGVQKLEQGNSVVKSTIVPLRVDLRVRTPGFCSSLDVPSLVVRSVCAGDLESLGTCGADPVGPLFIETSGGDALVGIVSAFNGCAKNSQLGAYRRVSDVQAWIREHTASAVFVP